MQDVLELSVRFTVADKKDEDSPIQVSLFCPQTGTMTDPVAFQPPLDDAVLDDLRWYLETFSDWPTGPDYERADGIKARMEGWGRDLLGSVVADVKTAGLWQQFIDAEVDGKLLTVDATDPRVLRLPWELLADEHGHLFAAGIGVRRRLRESTRSRIREFALPVRLLVVVCRPEGAGFIDPRAVSLPLLDALEGLGASVEAEFLYPPTLPALTRRLRDRRAPQVHIVHFDGHGVYDSDNGLGYLLFEDERHKPNLVDADQLGTLLYDCGIPLMVLNACQSARQEEANPYASVAARLIRAGVGSVLAMSYSVLVVAAKKFVSAFYGSLAGGCSVGRAVDEGRFALLSDEQRHTLTRRDDQDDLVEETVRLRDWFLPALYQQSADPVVFASTTTSVGGAQPPPTQNVGHPTTQRPKALTDPTVPGGLPAEPLHGFQGRSREMLQLERALAEKSAVVLHGFGGMGKTALAAEAGRWFHRTGRFPGGAAFVSFEHGGSLDQLCSWVGQAVSGDPDFAIHGPAAGSSGGDLVTRVGALLRERPALLILDNFESVLGRDPVIPPEELQAILDAVWSWATDSPLPPTASDERGKGQGWGSDSPLPPAASGERGRGQGWGSRLLITTRDTTFNDSRFAPSMRCAHIPLSGLAEADALALAAAVLDNHGIDRAAIPRQALVDLMAHLGGHPLSLYLVLPHLREHTPQALIARFEELLPGFVSGKAAERNESLAVSLEFSLRRLGKETRAALPALAVFQGGCMEYDLLAVTQIDPELWAAARAELEAAALVTAEPVPGVSVPFLRFHPTLLPYLSTQLPDGQRAELEDRYWREYYATAKSLYRADAQTPHQARAIAVRELPNLRRALGLALDAGAAAEAVEFATAIARFLDAFGRRRERDALLGQVRARATQEAGAGSQEAGAGPLTKTAYLLASRQGEALLQQGREAEAERVFRALLARLEGETAYDAAYDRAATSMRLGRCLAAQGRPGQAVEWQRRALGGFERLSGSSESAKGMLAVVGADLADSLCDLGQFDAAASQYEAALSNAREAEDRRQVGVVLGQLGSLALARGDRVEAERRYREALETFRALGEPREEAVWWHQLGVVAQKAQAWEEAERCYRESLRLEEQMNHAEGVAQTSNQLAIVAKGAGRPDDAERWYLRAIEIDEQLGNPKEIAPDYSNLAGLYLSQGRLDEAESYARRAAEIMETLDLSAEPWKTYNILAKIAEARGRGGEAAGWRRKEQESYAAYAGSSLDVQKWEEEIGIVVAACQGNAQARQVAGQIIAHYRDSESWGKLVAVFGRILDGERDLVTLGANLDRIDYAIVQTLLDRLSGKTPSPPGPLSHGGEGEGREGSPSPAVGERGSGGEGVSLGEFLALVAHACGPEAPAGLAAQLHAATQNMAAQPGLPEELRALARALNRVLSGERDLDLSGLPPQLAAAVEALLAGLP